jgi:hypothetical protein
MAHMQAGFLAINRLNSSPEQFQWYYQQTRAT